MNTTQARRTVLLAVGVLMSMIAFQGYRCKNQGGTGGKLKCGGDTFGRLWVAGLLGIGLAFAADIAPGLVVPFSFAIVVGFAYKNPGLLSSFIGEGVKTAAPEAKPPGVQGPVGKPSKPVKPPPGVTGPVG